MEKIIIRDMVLSRGHINSAFINLCEEKSFGLTEDFLNEYGINVIMKELYKEDVSCEKLDESLLYESYKEVLQSGKENNYFKLVYKIDEEFAVHLTENIYLYHLAPTEEIYSAIVPWIYTDSKIFLGDTWWEEDNTILHDLRNISIIEFMKKYKGY